MFVYYKCYIPIEYTFLKELMLIKQVNQKSVILSLMVFLKLYFQLNVCNRCHDLLMLFMNLSDIDILNSKDSDYHCIIALISKNEAISSIQNSDLTEKSGTL